MKNVSAKDFSEWRETSRMLLSEGIAPHKVIWAEQAQPSLFSDMETAMIAASFSIPREFIPLAEIAACHISADRWELLYRLVWRLVHENRHLLHIVTDQDVHQLHHMVKEVRRDAHKMKAFVRFRKSEEGEDYIAWHEPSHYVVRLVAPFFARRFTAMRWAILTHYESVSWDGEGLHFSDGVPRHLAPKKDDMEELWKTFYRNIFNPARIKIKMMKSEMPVKYWHTMPETQLIPSMLEEADRRIKEMLRNNAF